MWFFFLFYSVESEFSIARFTKATFPNLFSRHANQVIRSALHYHLLPPYSQLSAMIMTNNSFYLVAFLLWKPCVFLDGVCLAFVRSFHPHNLFNVIECKALGLLYLSDFILCNLCPFVAMMHLDYWYFSPLSNFLHSYHHFWGR